MEILSRGDVVGFLTNAMPDMHYLEGDYRSAATEAGAIFAHRVAALDARTALMDPTRAIRVLVRETCTEPATLFLIMALTDGRLFGRRIFEPAAAQWAIAHVPE